MALLTVNSGSSSLKLGLYAEDGVHLLLAGQADSIGHGTGSLRLRDADGKELVREEGTYATQADALAALSRGMAAHGAEKIAAVGHRMVHGGPRLREHCALTDEVLATLEAAVHFAPLHIPAAVALVRATEGQFPGARQFACFDTQFHATMPVEAYTYPVPAAYREAGVRRYGFHGLSYESIVRQMGVELRGRTVVAHLGGGSSLCALEDGRSVDTSMGVSPCGGVPMATRSGDLDPGVVLLMERRLSPELPGLTPDALETVLNKGSGMEALAGETDMRALTKRAEAGDEAARLALRIFTRDVAKTVAGFASVLGGLEMLVFTGGIGEHSNAVRDEVCGRLGWMGVGGPGSRVEVRVEPADEDGQIALHVARLMRDGSGSSPGQTSRL